MSVLFIGCTSKLDHSRCEWFIEQGGMNSSNLELNTHIIALAMSGDEHFEKNFDAHAFKKNGSQMGVCLTTKVVSPLGDSCGNHYYTFSKVNG